MILLSLRTFIYVYVCISLLVLEINSFSVQFSQQFTISQRQYQLEPLYALNSAKTRQTTYIPIEIGNDDSTNETFLVRNDKTEVIKKWIKNKKQVNGDQLSKWMKEGIMFPSSNAGIAALQQAEKSSTSTPYSPIANRPPSYQRMQPNVYINIGEKDSDELRLIKTSVGTSVISDVKKGTMSFDTLVQRGAAFQNLTQLFIDERITSKGNYIARKLIHEYNITSDEWSRYTNYTNAYDATSLTQVVAQYFREQSIGDLGGDGSGYIPRLGYPGTLAPGDGMKESNPFDDLPNYIVHPWPAMQEIPVHVRWPPSHPAIFPPLLWIALNNMYTRNFVEKQMSAEYEDSPVVGGPYMEAKDALRIAQRARFGLSYRPEEQLPHGGMLFTGGHHIPYYNPDHGPTVAAEEAEVEVPFELRHLTERWFNPEEAQGSIIEKIEGHIDDDEMDEDDMKDEEEARRVAAESALKQYSSVRILTDDALLKVEEEESEDDAHRIQERVDNIQRKRRGGIIDRSIIPPRSSSDMVISPARFREIYAKSDVEFDPDPEPDEVELQRQQLVDEDRAKREIWREQQAEAALKGRVRSQRELISYTVRIMSDMQRDIAHAARSSGNRNSGKGRKAKRRVDELKVFTSSADPFLEPTVLPDD